MKKFILTAAVLLNLILLCCTPDAPLTPSQKAKTYVLAEMDTLAHIAEHKLLRLASAGPSDSIRIAFAETRLAYKQVELFTEYYAPTASKELNGAALPEIEVEETKTFEPSGLQVIEEHLYPVYEESNRKELVREIKKFISILGRARNVLESTEFTEAHLLSACKQEIYRIMVLGMAGFDTPLAATGIQEASIALTAVKEVLSFFGENPELEKLLHEAIVYTSQQHNFDSFDRMAFIMRFANPITRTLTNWQTELNIPAADAQSVLNPIAATLFDQDAVNINYFAGSSEAQATPAKIKLGKMLFFDPVVAGGTRTCGTCHRPELAFTDGMPKSAAIEAGKVVQRNAPTLLYAGLQHAQFYDMRATSLENQAEAVILNKEEMHGSVTEAANRLNRQQNYLQAFQEAFPEMKAEVTPKHVMIALASYVRSLAPFNSRFDRHMRGEKELLSVEEVKGFNLFMGKAKCGTCHFMPVFNGTAAPAFNNTEGEVIGVLQNPNAALPKLDADEGRYVQNQLAELRYSFKTPTVRNIAKTAPYMHNGAYTGLEQVMDFYNKGGAAGMGLILENQTLPSDPLNLREDEIQAIIAFLQTLTDDTYAN